MFTLVNAFYERLVFLPLTEDVICLSDGSGKPTPIKFRTVLVVQGCTASPHFINRPITQQVRNANENALKVNGRTIKANNMNQTVLASTKEQDNKQLDDIPCHQEKDKNGILPRMLVHPIIFLNQVYIISCSPHHFECAAIAYLSATVWLELPVPEVSKEIYAGSHSLYFSIFCRDTNCLVKVIDVWNTTFPSLRIWKNSVKAYKFIHFLII